MTHSATLAARTAPPAATGLAATQTWSSRLGFILAAVGSAVGLGNIWKFPYIVGEYGGGAFVLVYLICVAAIGLPVLIAEIVIGRRGGGSPIHAMRTLAQREGNSRAWSLVGWIGIVCAFLILSFYSVVAGWSLLYLGFAAGGEITASAGVDAADKMASLFTRLLADPGRLIAGHTLIMAATIFVVMRGVRGGLESAVRIMVPGLFAILIGLVIFAAATTGEFARAAAFLFRPNFSALTLDAVLVALGHAFFTLSIGMTAMMAYGAHLKRGDDVPSAALAIAGLDTVVALLAGLAIFPIVFSQGLEPSAGPGLVFVTLPIAFSQIAYGGVIACVFFLFLGIAALSSTISVLEPVVEYMEEHTPFGRAGSACIAGGAIWILGLGSVFAFNIGADVKLFGMNFFDLLDYVTANILLPVGGMLVALYAGRALSEKAAREEFGGGGLAFHAWRFMLRYVAPAGIGAVLVTNLIQSAH
ncbi:MAG: sodium-dependent transporter [Parvularculaceae bacterium]